MNDPNSVFLVGRLKGEAELVVDGVTPKLTFQLMNKYNVFDEGKKEYAEEIGVYDIALSGKQAEKLLPHLKKGSRIGVNGRLVQRRKQIAISAYTIQFLDSRVLGD